MRWTTESVLEGQVKNNIARETVKTLHNSVDLIKLRNLKLFRHIYPTGWKSNDCWRQWRWLKVRN